MLIGSLQKHSPRWVLDNIDPCPIHPPRPPVTHFLRNGPITPKGMQGDIGEQKDLIMGALAPGQDNIEGTFPRRKD